VDYKKELRFFFLYAFKVVCVSFFFLKFAVMTSYKTAVLDNGLRIIVLPSASSVVYCGYQINAGTANEGTDEEGVEAGGVEEDPLGLFGDRGAHVVGETARAGVNVLGQGGDFGEGADGDGGGEGGDDGGDFEAQVEAGVGLGDAANRAIASA